jgi:hypothetical protein
LTEVRHFHRQKPFYPYVVHYQLQLLGMRELALRGIFGPRDVESTLPAVETAVAGNINDIRAYARWLNGPLRIKSEAEGVFSLIDPDETAREMWLNKPYVQRFVLGAAGTLLLLAFEATKESPARNVDPVWEFLRHCRNAIAHNNRLHFVGSEPTRAAAWRRFSLTSDLHGTSLWGPTPGLLGPADPIDLLWDIEQAYPTLSTIDE